MAKKVPNFDNESGGGGNSSPSNPNDGKSAFDRWFSKELFRIGNVPVSQGPVVIMGLFILGFAIFG